jgi:hypothetical protein
LWLFRYRKRWIGLGSLDKLSLAKARKKATEPRERTNDCADSINDRRVDRLAKAVEEKKATAKAMAFDPCRDAYFAAHEAE